MNQDNVKKPVKFLGLSRNVISMGWVSFLNDLSSDMIFPFIPIFLTSVLGAGAVFVGLVEGMADATASVLKIVSGRISDKLRVRKPLVVTGYGLSALAKPMLAFALAPWHVLAVRLVDRVGKGTRDAPRDALLSLSVEKKDVGRAFGFHRGADTLGAALGPLLAFIILPLIGNDLRTLFLLSFVASAIAVVITWLFVKEVKSRQPIPTVPEIKPEALSFKKLGVPFLIFLAAATIFALAKASDAFLLLQAQNIGVALALLPIIYFVYNITFALLSTPAGIISDKIGHRNTFMFGMLIFSATYYFFAQAQNLSAIWILFAVYGFYSAMTEGVGRAIVADLVPERLRGTAYGVYNAFTGVAALPAGIVFGLLWDRFGPAYSFYYGATMGILAFLVFSILRIRNHATA